MRKRKAGAGSAFLRFMGAGPYGRAVLIGLTVPLVAVKINVDGDPAKGECVVFIRHRFPRCKVATVSVVVPVNLRGVVLKCQGEGRFDRHGLVLDRERPAAM